MVAGLRSNLTDSQSLTLCTHIQLDCRCSLEILWTAILLMGSSFSVWLELKLSDLLSEEHDMIYFRRLMFLFMHSLMYLLD